MPAISALKLIEGLALLWRSKRLPQDETGGPIEVLTVTLALFLN